MTDVRGRVVTDQTNLLTALLAVQNEVPTLPKDATNPHYNSRYTPLDTIVEHVGPILNRNGLVWMALPAGTQDAPTLKYSLLHPGSGEGIHGEMPLLLTKADAQGLGSALTYARRYSLCAVLNLVADDDDDGQAAAQHGNGADRFTKPSDKQITYLKSLVTKSGAPVRTLRAMLDTVQAQDVEIVEGWTAKLQREQVSRLIELFKAGALPDPEQQDIPTDDPAPQAASEHGDDLPWEPEAA